MTRYHVLTCAAALFAFASVSPATLAQAGGHPTALNARPIQPQKVAKPNPKGQQATKVTAKPAPQSLRSLLSETP